MMMMMMMMVVMLLRAFEPPGLASAFPRERLYELASAKFDSTFFAISASSRVFECVHTHALAIAFYNRMHAAAMTTAVSSLCAVTKDIVARVHLYLSMGFMAR